ncbi:glycosyltransferase [Bradyrhizobium sp.]|uniref:glycosyltransferase n=1 Tax=Bradyrhizobium sp. TaxID=376 RepID=UPI0039C862AE
MPPSIGLVFLRQAVASALGQTGFDDFEVLVVDDCSDDATWSYLQSIECTPADHAQ